MIGHLRRIGIALTHGLLAGGLGGCVWEDQAIPTDPVRSARDYPPTLVEPERMATIPGMSFAKTGEIAAFLGTRNFRMAFASWFDDQPNPAKTGVYVVTPGRDDQPPIIHRFSRGRETFLGEGQADLIRGCRLSPDGKFLAYSLSQAYNRPLTLPTVWMQGLEKGVTWRVPVASSANQSLGIPGDSPFWLLSLGKTYLLFAGRERAFTLADDTGQAMLRQVEVLAPDRVSAIVPFRIGSRPVRDTITGISGGGKWFVSESYGLSRLLDSAQVSGSVPPGIDPVQVHAGSGISGISLNPFDPEETENTDYFTVTFQPDLIYSPWRTLEGGSVTADRFGDAVLVCNSRREVIYWKSLAFDPPEPFQWARWSTHPNFILAGTGHEVTVVKLDASVDALYANPADRTREVAGAMVILKVDNVGIPIGQGEFTLWVER